MARIRLDNIGHSYSGTLSENDYAVKPLTMEWRDGGAYALLGPSGCGKTTMLNIISGLVTPVHGKVWFDERDVTGVPTARRNIAQVFQFPVIYKSMTVFENLAFPLVCRKWPKARIRSRVGEIAELLDLGGKLRSGVGGLTADQKQLISLGRGLVRDDVSAVLLDEPLTVIDPQLRLHLRRKLKEIHGRFNLTLLYVTHDQNEAMTFADEIVVMNHGRVAQVGTPADLFEAPLTGFVGYFIGTPAMNFLAAEARDGAVRLDGIVIAGVPADHLPSGLVTIGIRPEYVDFTDSPGINSLPARVVDVLDYGNVRVIDLVVAGRKVKAKLQRERAVPSGDVWIRLPVDKIRLYVDNQLVTAAALSGLHHSHSALR
jgi:glycerol transport system ATP-binding protein